jgi:hypothetical protein
MQVALVWTTMPAIQHGQVGTVGCVELPAVMLVLVSCNCLPCCNGMLSCSAAPCNDVISQSGMSDANDWLCHTFPAVRQPTLIANICSLPLGGICRGYTAAWEPVQGKQHPHFR